MPRVQVLGREPEPVSTSIRQGVQGLSGVLQKQQESINNSAKLQIAIKELDIAAKNTENQAEQNRISKIKQLLEFGKHLDEKNIPDHLKLPALKQFTNQIGLDFMEGLGEFGKAMSLGSEPDALDEAKTRKYEAEAAMMEGGLESGMFGGGGMPGLQDSQELNMVVDKITSDGKVTYKNLAKPEATASQKEALTLAKQQEVVVEQLERQADKVEAQGPLAGRLGSLAAKASGGEIFGEELKTYVDYLPMTAVGLYKTISGDRRINNQDAADRAMPLMWNPAAGEGKKMKEKKFRFLKALIQARKKLLEEGNYIIQDGLLITPVNQVMAEASKDAEAIFSYDSADEAYRAGASGVIPAGATVIVGDEEFIWEED